MHQEREWETGSRKWGQQKPKVTGGRGMRFWKRWARGKGEGTRAAWGRGRRVRGGAEEREEAG